METKRCPLVKDTDGNTVDCGQDLCAWWDDLRSRCGMQCISIMSYQLEKIQETLEAGLPI